MSPLIELDSTSGQECENLSYTILICRDRFSVENTNVYICIIKLLFWHQTEYESFHPSEWRLNIHPIRLYRAPNASNSFVLFRSKQMVFLVTNQQTNALPGLRHILIEIDFCWNLRDESRAIFQSSSERRPWHAFPLISPPDKLAYQSSLF